MSLWGVGVGRMVIFLAGLQGIPESLLKASLLDGAGPWRRFRDVTLLSPVLFFNLVMGCIGAFQVFSSSLVAYGFARFRFRGRDLLFGFLLATLTLR